MAYFHRFSTPFSRREIIVFVILLIVFALAVRLHHLDYESLFMDELRQVSYYPHSFYQIIPEAASTAQPPLDYWIGHLVYFFSYSDFAVRLPSALFGTGAVFFLAVLVGNMCSWPSGIGVGIISALLPFNLYFSQEARPYSIAVFFFLGVLWSLNRLLTSQDKRLEKVFLLILFSTAFLYSRTLSPLVVTVVLIFILAGRFCLLIGYDSITCSGEHGYAFLFHKIILKKEHRCILLAILGLLSAIFIYFPSLNVIFAYSGQYADTSFTFDADTVADVIKNFDISPMWRAFVAQTEPLSVPLLILLILSPFFARQYGVWQGNPLRIICTLLLPGAAFVNLFIFQAKTHMPFRPPYAIYLLPLTLILSAISFQGMWNITEKMQRGRIIRFFLTVIIAILILDVGYSALAFKKIRKKTDWRGLATYLTQTFNAEHVLIFDALSPYETWEPTFYGFPRYYKGNSRLISMGQIPFLCNQMEKLTYEPVLILFQWREYYLTPYSQYPIMPLNNEMKGIDYNRINSDVFLKATDFTGFSVIRLKESTHNLAGDTYTMINRLLLHLPANSGVTELHLATASLAGVLALRNWQEHLTQAETLFKGHNRAKITDIGNYIKGLATKSGQSGNETP